MAPSETKPEIRFENIEEEAIAYRDALIEIVEAANRYFEGQSFVSSGLQDALTAANELIP